MPTPGPIQTAQAVPALPMARATRMICSAGIRVFLAAQAGVLSLSSRFQYLTMPWVCFSTNAASSTVAPVLKRFLPSLKSPTNSLLQNPSVNSTWPKAAARAPSSPGLMGSHSLALATEALMRGSTAINVPRSRTPLILAMALGTWRLDESGSQPQTTRHLVLARS